MSALPQPNHVVGADDVVLKVRELETVFQTRRVTVRAVRSISFDLRRGERLGIVGESGSGKSAAALSILGLLGAPGKVVGGQVQLNGRELRGLNDREMSRIRGNEISLVYQDPMSALDPVKTIGNQLLEVIRAHDRSISRAWRGAGRSSCCGTSTSPTLNGAWTITRTNIRAGCANVW